MCTRITLLRVSREDACTPRKDECAAKKHGCRQPEPLNIEIGIGGSLTAPPLPHHRAYGSVHGGSTELSFRRASGFGTRHAGFGPSVSGAPGFTLRVRLQGQFQLDILPLGPLERTVLLTLSIVRAFTGGPANMPSADFCLRFQKESLPPQSCSPRPEADLPR